ANAGRLRAGVLGDVLQRLENAEIDGRFDLLWKATDPLGVDLDRKRRLPRLGRERGRQSLIGQERRIDASGEVAEVVEGLGGVGLQGLQQLGDLRRVLRR